MLPPSLPPGAHNFAISFASPQAVEAIALDSVARSGSDIEFRYVNVPKGFAILDGMKAFYVVAVIQANCTTHQWRLAQSEVVTVTGRSHIVVQRGPSQVVPVGVLAGRELRMACGEVAIPARYKVIMTAGQFARFAPKGIAEDDR